MGDQTAAAVGDAAQPPAKSRIGTIVRFDAADMDVRIDEGLLRSAPYLRTFRPVLGERVLVQQYDQTWVVLGAFAGMPPDNPVPNPSFEDGTVGATPTGWTQLNVVTSAGTPSFTKQPTILGFEKIDGDHVGDIALDATAAADSEVQAVSAPVPVLLGQRWSASAYVTGIFLPENDITGYVAIGWYANASTTTPLSTTTVSAVNVPRDTEWRLLASEGDSGGAPAPAGASHMRIILTTHFVVVNDFDLLTADWDRVVAWRVS